MNSFWNITKIIFRFRMPLLYEILGLLIELFVIKLVS